MPSRDFTSEDLFSSLMMSMHSSTHSSQMNTVEPAMSLRTSCWLLPQNVQWSVFLESLPPALFISVPRLDACRRSRYCRLRLLARKCSIEHSKLPVQQIDQL